MTVLDTSVGNGDVFLWMLEFFLFVIWFWLLLTVFSDVFRDREMSGGSKAVWVIFVILLPYLGVLIYFIARGSGMADRHAAQVEQYQALYRQQANTRVALGSTAAPADQIAQAKAMLEAGTIDQAEFDKLKAAALAT